MAQSQHHQPGLQIPGSEYPVTCHRFLEDHEKAGFHYHSYVEGEIIVDKKQAERIEIKIETEDPRSGRSLVPMLIAGLVLGVIGMVIALIFT
jgi:hypothetical protein